MIYHQSITVFNKVWTSLKGFILNNRTGCANGKLTEEAALIRSGGQTPSSTKY